MSLFTEDRLQELEQYGPAEAYLLRAELRELVRVYRAQAQSPHIDIVFDGPPSHESGRFVEVENPEGKSISIGEWIQRLDGFWALRIPRDAHNG